MFEPVPDLNLEASVELGEVNIDQTTPMIKENSGFISRSRRLFAHRSKDDERKLALRFFLQRLYFLDHREIHYLFRCVDAVKDVTITKKNNIIVAPYIALLTIASKGCKLTETMIEAFFPELYNEHSKKFKFNSQVSIIQEKLGYQSGNYHVYDFEPYYSTVALAIRDEHSSGIFNIRQESYLVSSLSEITYRFYLINLKSDLVQWSASTGAVINQMVNTVLITVYDKLQLAIENDSQFTCSLAVESELPIKLLKDRNELFTKFINELKKTSSFKISKRDKDTLLKHFTYDWS
ncbi:Intermediate transcription factor VITF-3 (1) [Monkeypox virus]|nr:Intermediate transcription factor VITF-3 (1) [Monkeypox virus]AAL40577.1 A9R [Monkeypox virus Zaire-96-I-16]AAY97118.1 32kDa small subunit of transcription factor VITF-3 [Monkeypox virus]AAY97319.1 32kDa small subunit of transcription factor VITF-3 [Monkeypox virus]ADK39144.1 transcription factor VITF-3 32 kDa small subunit [Monkeypox virus]ADX22766.1 32 kDa small subunit of transcription factor VITF-3 [Monkeypox virus]